MLDLSMHLYRRNYGLFWYAYIDYKTIVYLFHDDFSRSRLTMDTRQFVSEQDSIKYILVLSQGSLILFSEKICLTLIKCEKTDIYIY